MTESDYFDDVELGKLGPLIAASVDAMGPVPDADELWNWMYGHCEPGRAIEIESHLAADEELFDLWQEFRQEIAEMNESAVATSADKLMYQDNRVEADNRGWQRPWLFGWPAGAIAYGAIASLLLVFLLPVHSPPKDQSVVQHLLWQHIRIPKATQDELTDTDDLTRQALQPVLVGIRDALLERDAAPVDPDGRQLPAEYPPCTDAQSNCLQQQNQLYRLGELSTITVMDCVSGEAVTVPPELEAIQAMVASREALSLLDGPLADWIVAVPVNSDPICAAASTLLTRALSANRLGNR